MDKCPYCGNALRRVQRHTELGARPATLVITFTGLCENADLHPPLRFTWQQEMTYQLQDVWPTRHAEAMAPRPPDEEVEVG